MPALLPCLLPCLAQVVIQEPPPPLPFPPPPTHSRTEEEVTLGHNDRITSRPDPNPTEGFWPPSSLDVLPSCKEMFCFSSHQFWEI